MDRPSEIAELVLTTLRESTVPLYARELVDELKAQGHAVDRKSVNDALNGPLAGQAEKLPDHRWVVRTISPSRAALESGSPSLTPGEWEVLDFFDEQLEAVWEIYVQPHMNGLRPDFVLLNEAIGVAVFEVKDWRLGDVQYEYYNDRKVKVMKANGQVEWPKNPIHQVKFYERDIKDLYCPRLGGISAPRALTAGVIFTRATTAKARGLLGVGPESPDEPSTDAAHPVSGSDAIAAGNLSVVFPAATTTGESPMSPEAAADLRAWLVEPRLPAELRAPIRLDSQQAQFARKRPPKGFRRIRGPAGSGKTLVLCSRAAQIQQTDPSSEILLVTYNITLLNYLAELVRRDGGKGNALTRLNFHSWAKRVTDDVGWEHQYKALWPKGKGADRDRQQRQVLNEELPQLVIDALDSPERRELTATYDVILVDEGQDFLPLWWSALRKALKPGGEMVLAADFGQGLYKRDRSWTESAMVGAGFSGRWAELKICYRLPESLRVLLDSFQREHAGDNYLPLERPAQTRIETCELFWKDSRAETLVDDAVAAAYELVRNAERLGAGASDVTVLADKDKFGKQIVKRLEGEANYRISHTFGASEKDSRRLKILFGHRRERNHRISVTTLHSFKGFEAPLLVVVLSKANSRFLSKANSRYFYAALSRLGGTIDGMSMIVVCSDPTLNAWGIDWPRFAVDPLHEQP